MGMSEVVSLDFETRSSTDIKLGVERYSRDPTCDVLTLSYRLPGDEGVSRWHRGFDLRQRVDSEMGDRIAALHDHIRRGGSLRGWNVAFEYHIWNNVCVPKYGWPQLPLEQCIDTMAQAAAMNLPQALGRCAAVLGLPADKQKDKRGKLLIQRLCKPHKPTKTRAGIWVEDPEMFAEFCDYCDQDVIVEEAVGRKTRALTEFEQRVWVLTQRINLRGVPLAVDEIGLIAEVVELEKERLNKELRQLTGRRVLKASARAQLLDWVNEQQGERIEFVDSVDTDEERPGHEELMPNLKGETVEKVLKRGDLKPAVRRALEIRAAVVQTSTAKFGKMLQIVADDGTAKNLFVYHGAGTGRWASRGGLNVQNFARPTLTAEAIELAFSLVRAGLASPGGAAWCHHQFVQFWGDQTMDAMVSCLRGVIKAKDGRVFYDADYSSVENRVAAWIAGQTDKLEMFAKGLDEYKTFASRRLFTCAYHEVTKDQRQYTKPVILGGIFGLGAKGMVDYAESMGVRMTLEEAEIAVKALRADYARVVACWYACGDAALAAVKDPGHWYDAGDKLRLIVHKNFLWMELPSGRRIAWSSPKAEYKKVPWTKTVVIGHDPVTGEPVTEQQEVWKECVTVESIDTYTRQWCRHVLTGSSAFQSAVQGTARDVLATGLLRTEEAGYETVLTAHDEGMAHTEIDFGGPEEFGRLLCERDEWYADLPLAFEAWTGTRFQK
jgi:DNA polymerase